MKILNEIQQKLKANKGQRNTFGNYNYRSCEDILEAVKPLLGEAVLTITDEMVMLGDRYYVKATATLRQEVNEKEHAAIRVSAYAREPESKKGMDEAQITGATSSYARKYALNGLFCIDDAKDADSTNKHGKGAEAPKAVEDPWAFVAKRGGFTAKKLKEKMAVVGVKTDDQLIKYGSDNAIKLVKGEE